MTRNRLLPAVIAILALLLTATVISSPADARAAKKPVRPKVGQCRTTTFTQAFANADAHKPVPCSHVHSLKTFAVVSVPKKFSLKKKPTMALFRWVYDACAPKYSRALGGGFTKIEQTAYSWWSFFPTKTEINRGARWVRCDLSLIATRLNNRSYFPPLPNLSFPMIGSRTITDTTRRCLASKTYLYETPCAFAHVARADQTYTLDIKGYPSAATLKSTAASHCPGKRYSTGAKWDWTRRGDHVVTCYSITTS
jgi:hypothetical protein